LDHLQNIGNHKFIERDFSLKHIFLALYLFFKVGSPQQQFAVLSLLLTATAWRPGANC
jgi:hypothetical protein